MPKRVPNFPPEKLEENKRLWEESCKRRADAEATRKRLARRSEERRELVEKIAYQAAVEAIDQFDRRSVAREANLRTRERLGLRSDQKVYFIQAGSDGPIKIGCARDVIKRRGQLQISHPSALRILLTIPGNQALEAELHVKFAAAHVRGEWFSPTAELLAFIEAEQAKYRPK